MNSARTFAIVARLATSGHCTNYMGQRRLDHLTKFSQLGRAYRFNSTYEVSDYVLPHT